MKSDGNIANTDFFKKSQLLTVSPTECRAGGRTGRECLECNSGKTSTDVRGRDMGMEEGTGKEIGGHRNANATMDVRSYETGQDKK